MTGVADELRAIKREADYRAGTALLTNDPSKDVLQKNAEALGDLAEPERHTISTGISIIEQPNYLRFKALKERTGNGSSPFSIIFDSFVVQRITRQRAATFDVRYTIGSPVIDVYHDGVELVTVNATIPDTEPFYTLSRPDAAAIAREQQNLALAQGTGKAAQTAAAAQRLNRELQGNELTGYLGESLEALRAIYNRYFRASAAVGSNQNAVGIVELWSKGRVDKGYLVKLSFERTSAQLDHAELAFDFFVSRSALKNVGKPEVIL